jgi:hypothetical protein
MDVQANAVQIVPNSLPKTPDAQEVDNMTDVDRRQILRESVQRHAL